MEAGTPPLSGALAQWGRVDALRYVGAAWVAAAANHPIGVGSVLGNRPSGAFF